MILLLLPYYCFKKLLKTPRDTHLLYSLNKISGHFAEREVQSVLHHKYQPHV